jgi:plasmid replication initiation protein
MQRIIKIKNIQNEEFEKYHWVDICKYKNGILKVKINRELKPFYLNLDWYTKYQLKNIMQFKSTYSFRLYELLKQYENLGNRIVNIDYLRVALDIDKKQYPKYANLKQKVINIAVTEINNNTDLHIEIEELKEVRKVISIKFIITSNSKAKNEITVALAEPPKDINKIKQVQEIFYKHTITELEAAVILKDADNDIEKIKQCYGYLLTKNKIDNVVGYMRTIVKYFVEPKTSNKIDNFNNFEQRTYDFKDLEKKLLGWDKD